MQWEYDSLITNNTWTLVPPPADHKIIQMHWVFQVKLHADGSVNCHKARFVAKGYTQDHGIDYNETFAPVAHFNSLQVVLAIATYNDLELHQMDVDTAFLNRVITEDIYITQPEGFIDPQHPDHVCKLQKCLYRLKQAPRVWNNTINQYLWTNGFSRAYPDPCIYIKTESCGQCIIFLYVDNLLIAATLSLMMEAKGLLSSWFKMKDLGEVKSLLGIEIQCDWTAGTLLLRQSGYIQDILNTFGMTECNPISTPLTAGISHSKLVEVSTFAKHLPFRNAIGKLVYAATATWLDSPLQQDICPGSPPVLTLSTGNQYCIFWYLQHSKDTSLCFDKHHPSGLTLFKYCNADWGEDINYWKSTSGYIFMLCGATVSWASKKQSTIATSSTEAEYTAATLATKEALWLRNLLKSLNVVQTSPTTMYEDNQGCIALTHNLVHHERTKHFDIQAHFVWEKFESRDIDLMHLPSAYNTADILTKPLPCNLFESLHNHIGLNLCLD